ncbi:MAG: bifunctional diaminohydroxyphosphoribosylaminopyrimidine deaminase/5-amino-6-(5-phosphoribosylamino)uracil reductase RibD [Bacteroidetes bacterium]|nr:bifunctional diaminohydroxyphosphoribosylaminopyrimidine deaminase/5-amino-6-(5-phosphoribosylamino)uracil reductase RibD [Bacteroidota bacterium]
MALSTEIHKRYMERCLELAKRGSGTVHPNPMVGCVIVKNKRVVGEGYHARYGGPHAEVNALARAGVKARGATVYVNLEPCAHYGKTPPCAEALVSAGVHHVVIATRDPNPLVNGKGLEVLRRAGVKVTVGVLEDEARKLNEKFFFAMERGLPYVALKIAQTIDGMLVDAYGRSQWITCEEARREAHRLRSIYDAILVGARTVAIDDPQLTVRLVYGRNPTRVILDGGLSVPEKAKVLDIASARTIIITSGKALEVKRRKALRLERRGVEVYGVGATKQVPLKSVLQLLGSLGVTSLLVEGGPATHALFLKENYVQKVYCVIAPLVLGGGKGIQFHPPLPLAKSRKLLITAVRQLGSDVLLEASPM